MSMEMIMISPRHLKVMMNADDMIEYDLASKETKEARANRRDALRRILRKAKDATGFDSEGARVTVRMFPSPDGGCEMFVTLNGGSDEGCSSPLTVCQAFAHDGMTVYSFGSLRELLGACKRLRDSGYSDESFAYRDKQNIRFFLALECATPLACEMGGTIMKRHAIAYIHEHCSLICSQAVFVLSKYV